MRHPIDDALDLPLGTDTTVKTEYKPVKKLLMLKV